METEFDGFFFHPRKKKIVNNNNKRSFYCGTGVRGAVGDFIVGLEEKNSRADHS